MIYFPTETTTIYLSAVTHSKYNEILIKNIFTITLFYKQLYRSNYLGLFYIVTKCCHIIGVTTHKYMKQ
jgi:hypothetical protein